ncbi:MAG: helix-turn-helix domain-containing protein [Campylobacterota bacterium]|nr:helix-turn-helix domain-containing protein [Campylobacterota bacterium]
MIDQFLTHSTQIQNTIKGFNLTKSLFISSILVGEPFTGKKTLIRYLFPSAAYIDGSDQNKVEQFLETHDELVITNFEKLSNIDNLDFENKRIIALANYISNEKTIDNLFAFIYYMPSLKERPEDIKLLSEHFLKEVKLNLMINKDFPIDMTNIDISANTHSLRKSIYQQAFSHTCDGGEIQEILYNYLLEAMEGNSDYKTYLPLYEKPLIEAGLHKFGSQLKLSEILGINRNTLRKKIHELGID